VQSEGCARLRSKRSGFPHRHTGIRTTYVQCPNLMAQNVRLIGRKREEDVPFLHQEHGRVISKRLAHLDGRRQWCHRVRVQTRIQDREPTIFNQILARSGNVSVYLVFLSPVLVLQGPSYRWIGPNFHCLQNPVQSAQFSPMGPMAASSWKLVGELEVARYAAGVRTIQHSHRGSSSWLGQSRCT
jgi:hypothetical protein